MIITIDKITMGFKALALIFLISITSLAYGQINGSASLCSGQTVTYQSAQTPRTYLWEVGGGTINGASTNSSVSITWGSGPSGSVSLHTDGGDGYVLTPVGGDGSVKGKGKSYSLSVSISSLSAGSISGSQTTCYFSATATITNVNSGSGGPYRWLVSGDNSLWSVIANADGPGYSPGKATTTKYYKRGVYSAQCGYKYSNTVTISVKPELQGGSISGPGTACDNTLPGQLTSQSPASGGTGNYSYQWQKSTTGVFNDLNDTNNISGATSSSYSSPNPILEDTYFRRRVIDACGTRFSNVIFIDVLKVDGGTISGNQTALIGKEATKLGSSDLASGATGPYHYQWQERTGSGSWSDITGATDIEYFPGKLKMTTEYRRKATDQGGCGSEYSNSVIVTVAGPDQNYVTTVQPLHEGVTEHADWFSLNPENFAINTRYFDGLGRLSQQVSMGATPDVHDQIVPVTYDAYGRQTISYLPYSDGKTEGIYKEDAVAGQLNFYQSAEKVAHDNRPYTESIYEPSPLNRVREQRGAGAAWQANGAATRYLYGTNTNSDNVALWKTDMATGLPVTASLYTEGQLYKNITIDEENHQVITFTDKQGQTILKRVQAHENGATTEEWADTYYIYDDFGNLRFVLPPMANEKLAAGATIDDPFLSQWAFCYKYDGRQRMIEKRVPGAGRVYMIYDNRDRLVLTQDGNQRTNNEWTFTKYDQLNRPVATGIYTDTTNTDRVAMQDHVNGRVGDEDGWYEIYNGNNTLHGYTDQAFPKGIPESDYLTITYYDGYDFKSLSGFDDYDYDASQLGSEIRGQETYTFPATAFDRVKGQVTGSKVKVLDENNTWMNSVTYYDDRYRVIQTITNYDGNISKHSTLYNFPGWVLATYTHHQENDTTTYGIKKRYTYDHAGRLMQGYHAVTINGADQGEVLLAENKYNELGELIEKNLHIENNAPQQSIDYRYNIRGWLESVNNSSLEIEPGINEDDVNPDLFGMELFYNNPLNGVPAGN